MNLQCISKIQAMDLLEEEFNCKLHNLMYYSFPQVFSTTAGPFKGMLAGQAMTTFTIEAWAVDDLAVLFCQGKIVKVCNEWQGPQSVRI